MNALEFLTNAMRRPPAPTSREGTTALVIEDTLEMGICAQVCFIGFLQHILCRAVVEIHRLYFN